MKQFIFLAALCLIPFLMNAQVGGSGNPTDNQSIQSYGLSAGTSGNFSVYMGTNAGYSSSSESVSNTFIGNNAGRLNSLGQYNVFIGRNAGYSETGSNKLVIDSKTTVNDGDTPLIYGDFDGDNEANGDQRYVGIAINPTTDIVSTTTYGLYVGKGILTEKVKVAPRDDAFWSDYVFEQDYDLNTIEEVEDFIKENKHLPNVPSAKEVSKNGVDVVEMDATLLRQIEELWLHLIELKKENETLKEEVASCNNDENSGDIEATEDVLPEQIEALKLNMIKLNERIQELEAQQDR